MSDKAELELRGSLAGAAGLVAVETALGSPPIETVTSGALATLAVGAGSRVSGTKADIINDMDFAW